MTKNRQSSSTNHQSTTSNTSSTSSSTNRCDLSTEPIFVGRSSRVSLSHKQYHRPPLQRYANVPRGLCASDSTIGSTCRSTFPSNSAARRTVYARDDSAIEVENLSMIWRQNGHCDFLVSSDNEDDDYDYDGFGGKYQYSFRAASGRLFDDTDDLNDNSRSMMRPKGSSTRGIVRPACELNRMDSMDSTTFAFRGASRCAQKNLGQYQFDFRRSYDTEPREDSILELPQSDSDSEDDKPTTSPRTYAYGQSVRKKKTQMNRRDMLESVREKVDEHKRLLDIDNPHTVKCSKTKEEQKRHNALLLGYQGETRNHCSHKGGNNKTANNSKLQTAKNNNTQKKTTFGKGRVTGWFRGHFGTGAAALKIPGALEESFDSTDSTAESSGSSNNPAAEADHEYVMCCRPKLHKTASEMRRASF